MTIEQTNELARLNELLVVLQNKCNRAQGALIKAEQLDGEVLDRMIEEARLELE